MRIDPFAGIALAIALAVTVLICLAPVPVWWGWSAGLVCGILAARVLRTAPSRRSVSPAPAPVVKDEHSLARTLENAVASESGEIDPVVLGARYHRDQRHACESIIDAILDDFLKMVCAHLDPHTAAVFFPVPQGGYQLRRHFSHSEHINTDAVIRPGVGVIGSFIKGGLRQLNLQEIVSDSVTLYYYTRDAGIRSLMASPIRVGGVERGTLLADSTQVKRFTDEDHAFLSMAASVMGQAVYYTYLANEHRLSHQRLVSMSQIEKGFFLNLDPDVVLDKMVEIIPFALSCDRLTITLRRHDEHRAIVRRAWGEQTAGLEGMEFSLDDKSLATLVYSRNIGIFRDFSPDHYEVRYTPGETPCREMASFMLLPFGMEHCIGTIMVESRRPGTYTEALRDLLARLATSAGLAIEKIGVIERAQALATHDGLTGLINHRQFQSLLKGEMGRARRYGEPLSLALADIDFFKKLNDSYGHPFGDVVLKGVSALLQESVRDNIDIAARYGGEEFAIVFVKTDGGQAAERLEIIRSAIEALLFRTDQGAEVHVTMSFGLAFLDEAVRNSDTLIKRADKALYRAKENGRNRVETAPGR